MPTIQSIETRDFRKQLEAGAGSDAVHTDPQYGYGVTLLKTDNGLTGSGIAYTLGSGTNLVCDAIQILAVQLQDGGTLAWTSQGRYAPRSRIDYQCLFRPLGQGAWCAVMEATAGPFT